MNMDRTNRQKTPKVCPSRNRQGFVSTVHTTIRGGIRQGDNSDWTVLTPRDTVSDLCALQADADKYGGV